MSGFTQAELDALKKAYARGVRSVTYDGQTVVYDDGEAMRKRIAIIEASLNAGGLNARPRGGFAGFSRGHD